MMVIAFMPLILIIFLIIASLYDLLNDMTIPLPVGIIGVCIRMVELITLESGKLKESITAALILFFIFGVGAVLGAYGGADIIFASMVGFYLGMDGIIAVGISCILSLPYAIYIKKKKDRTSQFPFVPYLLLASAIIVTLHFALGGSVWL